MLSSSCKFDHKSFGKGTLMLKKDILRTYNFIPGNKIKKIIGCYRSPGVHAVTTLRFGQWLSKQNMIVHLLLLPIYLFK
jgi:serine O-acetyltransferase